MLFHIDRRDPEVQSASQKRTRWLRHGQSAIHTGRKSSSEKIIRLVGCVRWCKLYCFHTYMLYEYAPLSIKPVIARFGFEIFIELIKLHDDVRLRGLSWFNSFRPEIKSEILRTVGFPPCTEQNWEQSTDGPAWTWWLLSLLPLGQNAHVSHAFIYVEYFKHGLGITRVDYIGITFDRFVGDRIRRYLRRNQYMFIFNKYYIIYSF